ncbi:MAG: hypothetical protein ACRDRB_04015 [Pseudonocardiaceae bacterium]
MTAAARRPVPDRWCDIDGIPISLFCLVEQVVEDPEPGVLPSRRHQRGRVVGRSLDSLYVRFPDDQLVSVRSRLLRLLSDTSGER